ncbi:2-succinyl-5-enolpyruvyl-6-hydroxy-3-cyclohexene-1-carboxylic-acid synthase [Halomarina oriensis]|uniref:2-succinyl-5-enolpyruvyl-6-hydroxy-3-cyclohexene-1-carboxylate synthase n=1 Tax=Halomarina oriensis TaxID=671145 RepID=A0A6B0GT34_9EURY|nr:2-succinyl-5-enolpyruvyl-6-hydroxy-3-cyclohexene-1-carboxylic-acid synthase [Halomarina oriensis]MWG36829.1 2-succinyl-5-enolpyruvyl-6-hydroxy-3-cyclohexene-1-carboxylic-acid synthase [Halomarina oriensis]
MSVPNRNTLWGRVVADELAKAGVDTAVLAPGSRSTPLTVAFAAHDGIETVSQLDERSAAFFALGRAKRTGVPVPLVSTSGTALANVHPAVIEANQARVPMLLLTADRPRVLQDSGANQTIDQEKLYGDAVRHYRTLPEPAADDRKLRALRTALSRAVGTATGSHPGPVHLNCPFEKPLEPTPVAGDVSDEFLAEHADVVKGRDGPWVEVTVGRMALSDDRRDRLARAVEDADRGLVVAGPDSGLDSDALCGLALSTGFPVLADPLSGVRFGDHIDAGGVLVCGGYDSWLGAFGSTDPTEAPDFVLRFGASPTSKPLRHYLRESGARQVVVDPAGGWREATFSATDLVTADPTRLAADLADRVDREAGAWHDRIAALEREYWSLVAEDGAWFEGAILRETVANLPDPATLFVSNSMPPRDLDRFGEPRGANVTALGNRGASGIDGIVSSALGAGHGTDDPLVLVVGDLAFYHDLNGLLACGRAAVDATVVLVNNDGGGIFRVLPIERFDPPFTDYFRTPHGLEFSPVADLYGLEFVSTDTREGFLDAYRASLDSPGTQIVEVRTDSEASHRHRERLHERVHETLG